MHSAQFSPLGRTDSEWEHVGDGESSSGSVPPPKRRDSSDLDTFFATAYPDSALRTFHTERVRRMPLSGLDPSMLVGFLIKDGLDWDDFCSRSRAVRSPLGFPDIC